MRRILLMLAVLAAPAIANGAEIPRLADTGLFRATAHDCRAIDLASWHHPTKAVLERDGVALTSLQLCNEGKLPVFTAAFHYDPLGDTSAFFHPFFSDMLTANGRWPLVVVDTRSRVAVTIKPKGRGLEVSYERFSAD